MCAMLYLWKYLRRQVSIGLAVFCIPWLRWKQPDWERPIRVNLVFPIIYILATVFITVVPMIVTPVETGTRSLELSTKLHEVSQCLRLLRALWKPSLTALELTIILNVTKYNIWKFYLQQSVWASLPRPSQSTLCSSPGKTNQGSSRISAVSRYLACDR